MRIKLTKDRATALLEARTQAGVSQYELADRLGWVRSKIKRLEKGEVQSIEEVDLELLEAELNVQESSKPREVVSKPRSSDNVVPMFKRGELFTRVQWVPRRVEGQNQVFFRVKMKTQVDVDALLGTPLELMGYAGRVHGVENAVGQDPLRPGDSVVIMLWGPGISKQGTMTSKKRRIRRK